MTMTESRPVRANHGVFENEQAALDGVVARLAASLDPLAIWLFGSRARGDARPDSDFDLMVVAKDGGTFGSDDYELVDRSIRGTGVGCDIVPCSAEDFADGMELNTSFVRRIMSEGRKVYEAGMT